MEPKQPFRRRRWITIGILIVVALAAIPAAWVADFYWGSATIDRAKTGPISGFWQSVPIWPRRFEISPQDPEHAEVVDWLNSVAERGKREGAKPASAFAIRSNTFEAYIRSSSVYLVVRNGTTHHIVLDREPRDNEFLESLRVRMNAAATAKNAATKPELQKKEPPKPAPQSEPAPSQPIEAAPQPTVELTAAEARLSEQFRKRDAAAMNRLASDYMGALDVYKKKGGPDPTTATTADALDDRLAALETAHKAHQKLLAAATEVATRTRNELRETEIRPEALDTIVKQRENFAAPGIAIHRLEGQIVDMTLERFRLLRANLGRWRVKAQSELVLLDAFPEKERDRYLELTDWIERLLADQQKMMNAAKGK